MDKKINMCFFNQIITVQKVMTISLLLFLVNSYAQDFKLAGLHYAHYPKSEMKGATNNQSTSFQEFGTFINIPKTFNNDSTALINGVGYGFVEATMYNYPLLPSNEHKKKLQLFYYDLMFVHKWNEQWILLVNLRPTIASDLEEKLSSDDFVFQGAIMVTKVINDKVNIGAGLVNSTRWGAPIVVPALNIRYKTKKHTINALLPLKVKYTYSLLPNEKLKLGAKYTLNGASFNISDTEISEIDKINYSRANIGGLISYKLTNILRLEAYGGVSMRRVYRLVDTKKNVHNFDSEDAPFFNIGFSLVAPSKKDNK